MAVWLFHFSFILIYFNLDNCLILKRCITLDWKFQHAIVSLLLLKFQLLANQPLSKIISLRLCFQEILTTDRAAQNFVLKASLADDVVLLAGEDVF